jgi:transcriptional regulator with XRE-family HTH domain
MPSLIFIGSQIASKRKALGFSQKELARRAHISRSTLDALENGRTGELGFSKIARLLGILGLELKLQNASPSRPTLDDLMEEDRHDQSLGRQR